MKSNRVSILALADGTTRICTEFADEHCLAYQYSGNPYPRLASEASALGLRIEKRGLYWHVDGLGFFQNFDDIVEFYGRHMGNPIVEVLKDEDPRAYPELREGK